MLVGYLMRGSKVDDGFPTLTNSELYEFLNDIDVAQRINIQCLSWRVGYPMQGSKVDEQDDLVFFGSIKSRKPCDQLA